ncbi:alpha/beta hydrolase [Halocynthiibacter namhaensis]|uniref:alpha/beta hydrolase n=1 Tax=Halocynthiibacter namhaensis TaxID=1290553 RepID=UPI00068A587D|nr:alpha/beta hydrolase [Halocynthiibacter namhaensis]
MSSENDPKPTQAVPFVRRRKVFYIPGYDPFHPRRYRELYRKESALQAEISGYDIALKRAEGGGPYGWHVDAKIGGQVVSSDFEVLVWSDIVKETMTQNIPRTYLMLARTAWTYIGSGAFSRLLKTRKGPMIAALYPIFMLTLQLLVACGLGMIFGNLTSRLLHGWLFVPVFALVLMFSLRGFRKIDNKLFAYYLMHDYSWSARNHGASPPELEAKIEAFRGRLLQSLSEGYDEILVVGHSSGAHIAVSLLADFSRRNNMPKGGTTVSLLTLGQVVPMVSFLKNANRLRGDLQFMSGQDVIPWVDVTAPGDGCAFALCDPVSVTGVAPKNKRWPLVFSASFTQSLTPARWKALRWRFFRLHFQYLCAFDAPKDYDYFQITAGPQTLWQRYENRPASKSRLEDPLSPYQDVL